MYDEGGVQKEWVCTVHNRIQWKSHQEEDFSWERWRSYKASCSYKAEIYQWVGMFIVAMLLLYDYNIKFLDLNLIIVFSGAVISYVYGLTS